MLIISNMQFLANYKIFQSSNLTHTREIHVVVVVVVVVVIIVVIAVVVIIE